VYAFYARDREAAVSRMGWFDGEPSVYVFSRVLRATG
jgi:hypothetical protein